MSLSLLDNILHPSTSPPKKNFPLPTHRGRRAAERERELCPEIRDSAREHTSSEMTSLGPRSVEGKPELVGESLKAEPQAWSPQGMSKVSLTLHRRPRWADDISSTLEKASSEEGRPTVSRSGANERRRVSIGPGCVKTDRLPNLGETGPAVGPEHGARAWIATNRAGPCGGRPGGGATVLSGRRCCAGTGYQRPCIKRAHPDPPVCTRLRGDTDSSGRPDVLPGPVPVTCCTGDAGDATGRVIEGGGRW